VASVADALSRLDIDSLKIQEEINCIIHIKSLISIHTALIFKEQAKVKNVG
jgi:hypothetical protein